MKKPTSARRKVRRPKNFKLNSDLELSVGRPGQALIYLKPNDKTYIWIENRHKKLHAWLGRAIKYLERK